MPDINSISRVGILGGGSAGYLAALTIRKKIPDVSVTLIESSVIGTIRVGESTTDHILSLLHKDLGIGIPEFMHAVLPVWKLGIRFKWGVPGDTYFDYGAVDPSIFTFWKYDEINSNLPSFLISKNKSLVAPLNNSKGLLGIPSEYKDLNYGYQFENGAFIRFLKDTARERGVEIIDTKICEIETHPESGAIASLTDVEGRNFQYDLYIDCSGFRSALMGETLESKFLGYEKSIFTDTAVLASAPHQGIIKSCTTTTTMNHGWQWTTPLQDEDHIGYVYSSDHASPEEAADELRRKNPGISIAREIKFRSGRREHFWKSNVVAIGNSYGFMEPLHGVALQLIILQIRDLINHWNFGLNDSDDKSKLNELMGNQWDYAMEVLALHFKHNKRLSTDFWNDCNRMIRLPRLENYVGYFEEIGPFSQRTVAEQNFLFPPEICQSVLGNFGIDTILLGLANKTPGKLHTENPADEPGKLVAQKREWKKYTERALPMNKVLGLICENPDLFDLTSLTQCYKELNIKKWQNPEATYA